MRTQQALPAQTRQRWALWLYGLLCLASAFMVNASHATELQPLQEALQAFKQAQAEIDSQRYDRAEVLLERVLMLHPEHAEARIELALLMARRGHGEGAQALLQSLIDDPRTQAEFAEALRGLKDQINKGFPAAGSLGAPKDQEPNTRLSAVAWRGEASISSSSNPLARTSVDAITITLPNGPLSLPLNQAAQSGTVIGLTLSRNTATYGTELAVQNASVSGTTPAARALLWGALPLSQWLPNAMENAGVPPVLAYAQLQRGLDAQHRSQLGVTAVLGAQRISLSHYEEHSVSDRGTTVRVEYHPARFWGTDWQASLEHSNSSVGPQAYWRTGLGVEKALGQGSKLLYQLTLQKDNYSYSALLRGGAPRKLSTAYVAFEQQMSMKGEKAFIWRAFSAQRRSNLELFNYNDIGVQLSIVQNWR